MEQQRRAAIDGWYHETQSSQQRHTPLDPCQTEPDSILLGLEQKIEPSLRRLLTQRNGLLFAAQTCYNKLFPKSVSLSRFQTLSLYDRLSSALTVAQVTGIQPLCSHYAARLAPLNCPDASRESNIRQTHLAQYARLLATQPTLINSAMLKQLADVGLSPQDIVLFSQLIGFVSFQARLLAVVNALAGRPATVLPGFPRPEDNDQRGFSLQLRSWHAFLPEVDLHKASKEQLDVLDFCAPDARESSFYRLLLQDSATLDALSAVTTHIMQQHGDEKSALKEWAAAATSRINGCLFCAGIHGRYYLDCGGETAHIDSLFQDNEAKNVAQSSIDPLVKSVKTLTQAPEKFDASAIQPLVNAGYSYPQILDVLLSSALFNWLNRLIQTLGESRPA
ncbi:peroxidase-related enzyme [Rouxiella badensis]|jgi:uncharacterized peroxidase-related enzyme|uniref:CMD domain-containing protein n=1 Tax=Rouxiella badensis TaxID=1646377 RepID=UPI0003694504|nr:peroxidase-related enzyme [Rouxiella badensis]MCC3734173.1 peroxidase-related enzyme [Rouxiella badensis]MCC3758710.1 peroxidase-related enzyme [Rouxiella badensis]QOI54474.1 peroxidase-related enzyme [Rouxiella badensis subsp. acadiensis]